MISSDGRPNVDPTSTVDPTAKLGHGTIVGPFAAIGRNVTLEAGAIVGPYSSVGLEVASGALADPGQITVGRDVVIGAGVRVTGQVKVGRLTRIGNGVSLYGPLTIGPRCVLFDNAVIGTPGQYPGRHEVGGLVEIGSDVVIREQVIVTRPVLGPKTTVGDGCYLMSRTQIDHDCQLGVGVKTATGVTLGGSVRIGDYTYLGMNAVVHQARQIGTLSMIGMNGVVLKHVPPYATLIERRFTKLNERGMALREVPAASIERIRAIYHSIGQGAGMPEITEEDRDPWVSSIVDFYESIGDEECTRPSFS